MVNLAKMLSTIGALTVSIAKKEIEHQLQLLVFVPRAVFALMESKTLVRLAVLERQKDLVISQTVLSAQGVTIAIIQ